MAKKANTKWKFMKLNGVLNRMYKVSDQGDIIVTKTKKPVVQSNMSKKCTKNGTDYQSVYLAGIGIVRAHRIVCETFHGVATKGRTQVSHIDERKDNNKAANLKWATPSEARRSWLAKNTTPRYTRSIVSRTKRMINKGLTNDAIAQKVGMSDSNVSAIKLGKLHAAVKPYTAEQFV